VLLVEGAPYVGANDLARLLGATKFWRSDVRRLVLRAGAHRVTLTPDHSFVVVDDRTVRLPVPVVSRGGELQSPVALVDSLPRDETLPRLVFEARRGLVVRVPRGGLVRSPEVSADDRLTRVVFPAEVPEGATVVSRARAHFGVRMPGAFVGTLPESLPPRSLVRSIVSARAATGSAFEFEVDDRAAGFRVVRVPASGADASGAPTGGEVTLEFLRVRRPGIEDFAAEAHPAQGVRVIVLDPGHGGSDPGVRAGGSIEKDLTLSLARLVRGELVRRLPIQVVLTREDDRSLTTEQRAEAANHARADLVLSLHFDAVPGTQRSGATAWCPPARVGARDGPFSTRGPLELLPWREVALRHAVRSRAAAEAVLGAIDSAGAGPVRLRERLTCPLLGVNAPGMLLDCATLTATGDRVRVEDPRGLRRLAAAIARGVARWAERP
jgi:N-acetylmuramoyl-L-alanine amidase